MKKLLFIFLLCIICLPSLAKNCSSDIYEKITQLESKETWQKVGDHLYFDTKSVENSDGYVQGTFKQYNLKLVRANVTCDKYKNKIYAYTIISVGAFCNEPNNGVKKLDYPIYKFYDINGKLLGEENIHKDWQKEFPSGRLGITYPENIENGNIYYDTLYKYSK